MNFYPPPTASSPIVWILRCLQVSITSALPSLSSSWLLELRLAGRVFTNWSGGPRESATATLNCTEIFMEQCIKLRATDVALPREKGGGEGGVLPHPPSTPLLSNCEDVVACALGREVSRALPSRCWESAFVSVTRGDAKLLKFWTRKQESSSWFLGTSLVYTQCSSFQVLLSQTWHTILLLGVSINQSCAMCITWLWTHIKWASPSQVIHKCLVLHINWE